MSLKALEAKWKQALASILAELTSEQFRTVLYLLNKIPQGKKEDKPKEEIPYLIIQYYGPEGSITEIDRIMKQIPRMDAAVQEPLRPFVEKLKKQGQKNKETTSKPATDQQSAKKRKSAAATTIKSPSASASGVKKPKPAAATTIKSPSASASGVKKPKPAAGTTTKSESTSGSVVKEPNPAAGINSISSSVSESVVKEPNPATDQLKNFLPDEKKPVSQLDTKTIAGQVMDPVGAMKPEPKTEKPDSFLNLAESTQPTKVQSVPVQTGRIEILKIKTSNKTYTHLKVDFSGQLKKVFVTTRVLEKAFGPNVEECLREQALTAVAKLQGNKIIELQKL